MTPRYFVGTMSIVSAALALLTTCQQSAIANPDYCVITKAHFAPPDSILHVGDTVTFHAVFFGDPACWPADTTSAALRWGGSDTVIALDSFTGHATALQVGRAELNVHLATRQANLGLWDITVQP